jgi:pyrroline-5-carboxylate reductase
VRLQVGVIGCGNLARAVVRGWDLPVLCADVDAGRAEALAAEVGGRALGCNAELAREADLVVLCHKPKQLAEVAAEIEGDARAVVSLLGSTPLAAVAAAYPDRPVYRVLPSLCAEVRRGPVALASSPPQALDADVRELFGRVGDVIVLDDGLIDVAMGLMSNSPAFYALIIEAQVDAGIRRGMPPETATALAVGAMGGTAALLEHRGGDTLALRRGVTSPGGSTARGLDVLERTGMRASLSAALDAVLD